MNCWLIVKSVFSLHAGYSLSALKNKLKFLVLAAMNWTELNLFCRAHVQRAGQVPGSRNSAGIACGRRALALH